MRHEMIALAIRGVLLLAKENAPLTLERAKIRGLKALKPVVGTEFIAREVA